MQKQKPQIFRLEAFDFFLVAGTGLMSNLVNDLEAIFRFM